MNSADAPGPSRRSRVSRGLLVWSGTALAAVTGLAWYLTAGRFVTSDNAYVKADVIEIAPRIDGTVSAVEVLSDQAVADGQELILLDDTEARLSVARAEAELAVEVNAIAALKGRVATARAAVQAARSAWDYRVREARRLEGLAEQGIAPRVAFDAAREAERDARDAVTIADRQLDQLLAELGADTAWPATEHPRVRLKRAALDQALVTLGYTVLRAPRAAQAGAVEIFPGEQVRAGERVLSLVGNSRPWLEVNLKETQLTRLRVGQPAEVWIDAYPGETWRAKVTSIGPATGAEFSLLPPENASGNWVKIVQRVPVRLDFTGSGPALPLRAGMSAEIQIDTGEENRRYRRLAATKVPKAGTP